MGTLLELEDPAPRLVALLAERHGLEVPLAVARRAFAREIAYYRAHHLEGRDRQTLTSLRRRCAQALGEGLGSAAAGLSVDQLAELLLASLRFRLFPETLAVVAQLRNRGISLGVVSNWDISLEDRLAELGLTPYLQAVVSSAAAGAAKPDPQPFALALQRLGREAGETLHLGDSPEEDLAGAAAAGIRAVLIDRSATRPGALRSLVGVLDLLQPS